MGLVGINMDEKIIRGLISNAALLISLSLIYDWLFLRFKQRGVLRDVITGTVLGSFALFVMLLPWELSPGLVFDTRSIILSITGLYFGVIPTMIASVMAAVTRAVMGGVGMWTGLGVIFSSGLIGLLWRYLRLQKLKTIKYYELYVLGLAVHLVMLAWMLILPWKVATRTLQNIAVPVLVIYPLAGMLLGLLMRSYLNRRTRELQFFNYIQKAPHGIFVTDKTGNYREVNPAACTITGYSRKQLLNMHLADIIPPDARDTAAAHFATVSSQGIATGEFPFINKAGERRYWTVDAINLDEHQLIGFVRDVTDSHNALNNLREALEEKNVLLKELYHRTKNNMQVIRSMLALQAAYSDQSAVKGVFKDIEQRIQSMSLVHQMLYQSGNLSHLNMNAYFTELTSLLISSSSLIQKPTVTLNIDKNLELSIEKAIPCGLIVTELISNSCKHAFADTAHPGITLELIPNGNSVLLNYMDNGPGLKSPAIFTESKTLGLKTVKTIVEHQLNGDFKVPATGGKGFLISIVFKSSMDQPDNLEIKENITG